MTPGGQERSDPGMSLQERLATVLDDILPIQREDDGALTVHHDETFATKVGMPSVFAHRMFSMGLLSNVIANWAGIASLVRYDVQFRAITWPGDRVSCTGKVVGKRQEGGRKLVDVELRCETKPGTRTIIGSATVAL